MELYYQGYKGIRNTVSVKVGKAIQDVLVEILNHPELNSVTGEQVETEITLAINGILNGLKPNISSFIDDYRKEGAQ